MCLRSCSGIFAYLPAAFTREIGVDFLVADVTALARDARTREILRLTVYPSTVFVLPLYFLFFQRPCVSDSLTSPLAAILCLNPTRQHVALRDKSSKPSGAPDARNLAAA